MEAQIDHGYADDEPYDEDRNVTPKPEPGFYVVSVYLVDRAFGGPEEGGWYYDCGEPVVGEEFPIPVIVRSWNEAQLVKTEMQKILNATVNVGRRPIWSVLSQGTYDAVITAGFPEPFPEAQPHYE